MMKWFILILPLLLLSCGDVERIQRLEREVISLTNTVSDLDFLLYELRQRDTSLRLSLEGQKNLVNRLSGDKARVAYQLSQQKQANNLLLSEIRELRIANREIDSLKSELVRKDTAIAEGNKTIIDVLVNYYQAPKEIADQALQESYDSLIIIENQIDALPAFDCSLPDYPTLLTGRVRYSERIELIEKLLALQK